MLTPASPTLARPIGTTSGRLASARSKYQRDGAAGMSGGRLLVLLYQRLVRDLRTAADAIDGRRIEEAHLNLVHAQEIVDQLDAALDRSAWDQADAMSAIYGFLRSQLVAANLKKDATVVGACLRIVEPLASGWEEALGLTTGEPVTSAAGAGTAPEGRAS